MSRAAQGLRAWLMQRITAVYLTIYLLSVLLYLYSLDEVDFQVWQHWLAGPWVGVTTTLFVLALLLHVWVGIRDVLIDYVHGVGLRLSFMAITALVLLGSLLWVIRALAIVAMRGEV